MSEQTIFIKEATSEPGILKVEEILNQLYGIERVLVDTDDGEVKVEFDEKAISKERIVTTLIENNFTILQ
ncbi:metal ABC transporter ATPase [Paucisalibacillus sp. EB02]|uniref:metal ABC transporter ATPase n=1 Tax=Paucisalibacillus sp. EB02 TaxID=1347087 RepID=UPI0005A7184F|nr:metal ABC transporter ATPase [Paucisalibacillus sp. EB02]